MAMHIHFREFFWSFFAFWSAVFPLWTWSTAFVTWTQFPLTHNTKQCTTSLWYTSMHIQACEKYISKPEFQCYLKSLLELRLRQPYQGRSERITRNHVGHFTFNGLIHMSLWTSTWCKSRSFFSISFTASCLSWISSTVFRIWSGSNKTQITFKFQIAKWKLNLLIL